MRNTLFLSLLAAVSTFGSAQVEDEPPLSCSDLIVSIVTQEDLDFFSQCPKIDYVVYVGKNFTGQFDMPNVKSVGKFSAGYYRPPRDRDDPVTSVSVPDLEEINDGWFMFGWLNNLESISAPKLHTVGELTVQGNPKLKNLTLPELKNASAGIIIDGPFDEINFPKLKDVAFMSINSTGDLDCLALGESLSSLAFHPRKHDSVIGLTCWTPDKNNRYSSSEYGLLAPYPDGEDDDDYDKDGGDGDDNKDGDEDKDGDDDKDGEDGDDNKDGDEDKDGDDDGDDGDNNGNKDDDDGDGNKGKDGDDGTGGDGDDGSKEQPKPAESASIRVQYLTALFGLVVLAAFNEFLM